MKKYKFLKIVLSFALLFNITALTTPTQAYCVEILTIDLNETTNRATHTGLLYNFSSSSVELQECLHIENMAALKMCICIYRNQVVMLRASHHTLKDGDKLLVFAPQIIHRFGCYTVIAVARYVLHECTSGNLVDLANKLESQLNSQNEIAKLADMRSKLSMRPTPRNHKFPIKERYDDRSYDDRRYDDRRYDRLHDNHRPRSRKTLPKAFSTNLNYEPKLSEDPLPIPSFWK